MTKISKLKETVDNFEFQKGDYAGAEKQLLVFAEAYALLKADDAEMLRSQFRNNRGQTTVLN